MSRFDLSRLRRMMPSATRRSRPTYPQLWSLITQEVEPASRTIDPADGMFKGNLEHYFGVGSSALRSILLGLIAAGREPSTVRQLLDLPCGHGRVLRWLPVAFPEAELTACDLLRDGVDFCRTELGAVPAYSREDPTHLELPGRFDLIWCGSLLTHLDEERWHDFLAFFSRHLTPSGVLIFTTHGRLVPLRIARGWDYGLDVEALRRLLEAFRSKGFGYVAYPGQAGYGISLSSASWTIGTLGAHPELRIISYHEAGWDRHQDVVTCMNDPLVAVSGAREEEFSAIGLG